MLSKLFRLLQQRGNKWLTPTSDYLSTCLRTYPLSILGGQRTLNSRPELLISMSSSHTVALEIEHGEKILIKRNMRTTLFTTVKIWDGVFENISISRDSFCLENLQLKFNCGPKELV